MAKIFLCGTCYTLAHGSPGPNPNYNFFMINLFNPPSHIAFYSSHIAKATLNQPKMMEKMIAEIFPSNAF